MEKYIKLDDAKELLYHCAFPSVRYTLLSPECALKLLDKLPTKELDDFTEGEWEWICSDPYNPDISRCSECGQLGEEKWSYCPRCGSKMKKKGKEIKYITQQGVTGTINIDGTKLSVEMFEMHPYKPPKELKTFVIPDYKE